MLWCQPPVLNLSRAEGVECRIKVGPACLSDTGRRFASGRLEWVGVRTGGRVAEVVGTSGVVVEVHVGEWLKGWEIGITVKLVDARECEVRQVVEDQFPPSEMLIFIYPRREAGYTSHPSFTLKSHWYPPVVFARC